MHRRATLRHTTQFTSRFQTALPDRPPWSGSGMAVARYSTRCLSSSGVYSWRNLYVDVSYARTRLVRTRITHVPGGRPPIALMVTCGPCSYFPSLMHLLTKVGISAYRGTNAYRALSLAWPCSCTITVSALVASLHSSPPFSCVCRLSATRELHKHTRRRIVRYATAGQMYAILRL